MASNTNSSRAVSMLGVAGIALIALIGFAFLIAG